MTKNAIGSESERSSQTFCATMLPSWLPSGWPWAGENCVTAIHRHRSHYASDKSHDREVGLRGNGEQLVDGREATKTTVARTVPVAFSATESFDIGVDLGSMVSPANEDKRPFAFDGKIGQVKVTQ